MKRKILLFALVLSIIICTFALTVSAVTVDISKGYAKYDTEKALYDENGEALTWYVDANGQTVYDLTKNVIQLSTNGTMSYVSDKVPSVKNVVIANFKNADGSDVTVDGASIIYFGPEMFRASGNLTHIYIPSSLESLSSNTNDPRNTFRECPNLKQVWFPEDSSVTVFGKFTFAKSTSLIEVNIPKNVISMGSGENGGWSIFGGCSSLEIVTFAKDSKLTYLPDQCFINCTSLKEIELPNSIEYAYQRVFQGCSSLETIKLGYNFKYHVNTGNDHNSFTYGTSSKEIYLSSNYYKEAPENLYWVSYVFDGGKNVKFFYAGSASDFAVTLENFKTATTNATTNNANFLNATVITKSQYDAAPSDYQNGDYIIVDCNPCEIYFDGKHTVGSPICERCNATIYCEDTAHNLEITLSYDSFGKDGVKTVRCLDCNSSALTKTAPALFVCKGYSSPIDNDNEISISFEINRAAIYEYERITQKSISYGVFAAAKEKLGDNDILSSDGTPADNVVKAEIDVDGLVSFELRLSGFVTDVQKSALLALGAYVCLTDSEGKSEYSFIQAHTPINNEKYHFISFKDVIAN